MFLIEILRFQTVAAAALSSEKCNESSFTCQSIMADYLEEGSINEVNISSNMRLVVLQRSNDYMNKCDILVRKGERAPPQKPRDSMSPAQQPRESIRASISPRAPILAIPRLSSATVQVVPEDAVVTEDNSRVSVVIHPKSADSDSHHRSSSIAVEGSTAVAGTLSSPAYSLKSRMSNSLRYTLVMAARQAAIPSHHSAEFPTFKGTADDAQEVFKPVYDEIEKMLNDNLLNAFKSTNGYREAGGMAALVAR